MVNRELGRIEPTTFEHIEQYPAVRLLERPAPPNTKKRLKFNFSWRVRYDQKNTSKCVGHSSCQERSIVERMAFDPDWLYAECKKRDGYDGPGTYLSIAYDVLRELGPVPVRRGVPAHQHGVERNEWATTIYEILAALWAGKPVVVGTNWYQDMFKPRLIDGQFRLPDNPTGVVTGGHAYMIHGYDDKRAAFLTPNSWGPTDGAWEPHEPGWPVTEIPYILMERLLNEYGEAVLVTDR